jgi:hypothetical protein
MGHGVTVASQFGGVRTQESKRDARTYHADLGEPVGPPKQPQAAERYKTNCDEPANAEEADLCEQPRMAKASEELVALTDWQVTLSYWEIGGLLGSVCLPRLPPWLLLLLLGAANASVLIAEETAKRQLRAYVSVDPKIVYNWKERDRVIAVGLVTRNHGETPGSNIHFMFDMAVRDSIPNFEADHPNRRYEQNTALFPDAEVPVRLFYNARLSDVAVCDIEAGNMRFYTWGVMHYTDAFGQPQSTKFSFSFGGSDFARSMNGDRDAKWFWENCPGHNETT